MRVSRRRFPSPRSPFSAHQKRSSRDSNLLSFPGKKTGGDGGGDGGTFPKWNALISPPSCSAETLAGRGDDEILSHQAGRAGARELPVPPLQHPSLPRRNCTYSFGSVNFGVRNGTN